MEQAGSNGRGGRTGHIALFMAAFKTTGVSRAFVTLATAFARRGHQVDLVVARDAGPAREALVGALGAEVQIVPLDHYRRLPSPGRSTRRAVLSGIPALARYLRGEQPQVLIAGGNHPNAAAMLALRIAGARTRGIVSQHAHYSREIQAKPKDRRLASWALTRADRVVAVSRGVAEDLEAAVDLSGAAVHVCHPPVDVEAVAQESTAPEPHPWLAAGQPPVVLGVGRLHPQKDFPTLVQGFARLRARRPARLLILGTGRAGLRDGLHEEARRLGVAGDVALLGYVPNPFAFMSRAAVMALSSAWEGFGLVLIEAMACGCQVVSTDCPSGPAEILGNGDFGTLTPVGDSGALGEALEEAIDQPLPVEWLRQRARRVSPPALIADWESACLGTPPRAGGTPSSTAA